MRVELALTGDAIAELVGLLVDAQLAFAAGQDVEQDLESQTREIADDGIEGVAAQQEKAAHRVREIHSGDFVRQPGGERAHLRARLVPFADRTALSVARADGDVG